MLRQGSLQSGQRKRVAQVAAGIPVANGLGVEIHQQRQVCVFPANVHK
jgi:hypothetical protein